ncbi:helix-turn-helix transcriptional regulator [Acinetobacter higginsii]|uniref:helix-turn-helix transcriptional regulator n=1 Tax=Acinetobacter higginsii TaxID=70347 RepID=UPI003009A600
MITEREHQIIGMIYEAALNHQWDKVLVEIIAYTQSYSGFLTVLDQLDPTSNLIYSYNLPSELIEIYQNEELRVLDMQIHQPKLQQAGGVGHTVSLDWSSYADMPETSNEYILYQKCIHPSGVLFVIGMLLEEGKYRWGLLSVHRTKDMPFYTEKECVQLENFAVHLRRALQIHRQFNTIKKKSDDYQKILDKLKVGVMLVDSDYQLVYANLVAKNILENSSSLLWLDRYTKLKTKAHFQNQLNQYISSVCFNTETTEEVGGVLVLYQQPNEPLLKLSITPFTEPYGTLGHHKNQHLAMIFMTTMQQRYYLSTLYLSQTYNLSKREIMICELFINGRSLEEISEELKITLSSLRTYFKYIYEKTNCSSQTELMYLLMNITLDFEHIL